MKPDWNIEAAHCNVPKSEEELGLYAVHQGVNLFQYGCSAPCGAGEFRVQKEGFRVQIISNETLLNPRGNSKQFFVIG